MNVGRQGPGLAGGGALLDLTGIRRAHENRADISVRDQVVDREFNKGEARVMAYGPEALDASQELRRRSVGRGGKPIVDVGEYREYFVDASKYYADAPITGKRDDVIPGAPLQGIVVERRQSDVDVAKNGRHAGVSTARDTDVPADALISGVA